MALPLLFLAGASVVRAATPAIARYLVKQGFKRATGAAAKKPVSSVVTSIKQARNLKQPTKVVGKNTPKVPNVRQGKPSPTTTTPKNKPLRADPKNKPAGAGTPPKNKPKTTAAGTPTQRKIAGAGVTAASLATLIPKKESGKSQADTQKKRAARTGMGDRKSAPRTAANGKNNVKSFKDYKSVAAAQKDNFAFFMGADGKKKLAVTKEQLNKSGLSLNAFANKVRAGSSIKQLIAKSKK